MRSNRDTADNSAYFSAAPSSHRVKRWPSQGKPYALKPLDSPHARLAASFCCPLSPVPDSQAWLPADHLSAPPAPDLHDWLYVDRGSLTHRLSDLANGAFSVEPLNEGWQVMRADECAALDVAEGSEGWVREVYLRGCAKVTDAGVSDVAQSCAGIVKLDLSKCVKVCEFGEKALVEVGRNCTGLVMLNLTGCSHVRDGAVRALARGCPKLRRTIRRTGHFRSHP